MKCARSPGGAGAQDAKPFGSGGWHSVQEQFVYHNVVEPLLLEYTDFPDEASRNAFWPSVEREIQKVIVDFPSSSQVLRVPKGCYWLAVGKADSLQWKFPAGTRLKPRSVK